MNVCALHPLDQQKLRDLAELLCDFSAGRISREEAGEIDFLVGQLMAHTRDDCSADGSISSPNAFSDSLIGVLDARV